MGSGLAYKLKGQRLKEKEGLQLSVTGCRDEGQRYKVKAERYKVKGESSKVKGKNRRRMADDGGRSKVIGVMAAICFPFTYGIYHFFLQKGTKDEALPN